MVIINTKEIALLGDEWKKRVFFHHTGYPGGASWTLAWELHQKDPTMVSNNKFINTFLLVTQKFEIVKTDHEKGHIFSSRQKSQTKN